MQSDSLFYRLFQELPSCYFEAIGADTKEAEGYTFQSEELKHAGLRLDGVFVPSRAEAPVHFVEVYNYAAPNAFSNLFAKVFLWLEAKDPTQDWHASIFFSNRQLEPSKLLPYRNLVESDQVSRIYLDELPEPDEGQIGMGILKMIAATPERALVSAESLLTRVRGTEAAIGEQRKLVELIEAVLLAQFPNLQRKELEQMVQTLDLRETRVFQEAMAEGIEKGKEKTREEIAVRLLNKKFNAKSVAELTGLPLRQVQQLRKTKEGEK